MRRILDTQRAWVDAGRVLAYRTALELDLIKHSTNAETQAAAQRWCALVTPVMKSAFTHQAFHGGSDCLQVFGGHGYVREWGIEQIVRDARVAGDGGRVIVWSDDVTTVSFRTADGARVVIGDAEAVLAQVRYNLDLAAGKLDALEVEPVTSEDAQAVQALVDPFKSIEQRAREQVQAATVQHQDAAAGTDDALGRLPPAALPDIQRLIADVDAEQDQRDDPIAELRKSFKARGGGV